MAETWIAEWSLIIVDASGSRTQVCLRVAAPYADPRGFACVVALEGLEPPHTVYGMTSLQALQLGMQLLGHRLHALGERGVRLHLASDPATEVPPSAFLGALVRAP